VWHIELNNHLPKESAMIRPFRVILAAAFLLLAAIGFLAAFPLWFAIKGVECLGQIARDLAALTLQPAAFSLKVALAISHGPQSLLEDADLLEDNAGCGIAFSKQLRKLDDELDGVGDD
jgi:hypothetical protein